MTRRDRRYLKSTEFQRRVAELDARLDAGWIPPSGEAVADALGLPPEILQEAVMAAAEFLRAEMGPERILH